jgi:hypothetical protein
MSNNKSYNLDFIKQKLNQLNGGDRKGKAGNKKSFEDAPKLPFWKPKVGDNNIRFLPYRDKNGSPFHAISWYDSRLLSERRFVTPAQWDLEDPIQDFLVEAGKTRQPKPVWEFMRKISPQETFYAFIIDRDEEEKGVQVWELNSKRTTELFGYLNHVDYQDEDLFDTEKGYDWLVTCKTTDKTYNGNPVKDVTVSPRRKPSKLTSSKEKTQALLESIPNVEEHFKRWVKKPESINDLLSNALAAATGNATSTSENGTSIQETDGVQTQTQKNVDDAFADL